MNEMTKEPLLGEAVELDRAAPRNRRRLAIMLSVPLLICAIGLYFWLSGGDTVSTDNAYVKQDIVAISAEVSGPVAQVYVHENQHVKRGDILFRVDPAPVQVSLEQAEAQLAAARLETSKLRTEATSATTDIAGARDNLVFTRRALARQQALLREGFTTRARYDDALHQVQEAESRLADARASSANAAAELAPGGNQPAIAAANAAIDKARLDLKRGIVRAPFDGIVAKSESLLVGQTVIPGIAMLSLVRDRGAWVEANFKEGDLARMAVGESATVTFDAYPGLKVRGHVASIGAGTGSEFSLLPAQNANGNWVKVTQRVPVRIALDETPARAMIAGLSANVRVKLAGK